MADVLPSTRTLARITLASHFFKIDEISQEMRVLIRQFIQQFKQYGYEDVTITNDRGQFIRKETQRVMKACYAAFTASGREVRFHINTWERFKALLRDRGIADYQLELVTLPFLPSPDVEFVMYPGWSDREHQVKALAYTINPVPHGRKMLPLDPGRGKSYLTMRMSQELKARTVYIMRKGYIEKWGIDFAKTYDMDASDILNVSGKDGIKALTHRAVNGEVTEKLILISNTSWMRFIDLYETYEDGILEMGYACRPDELFGLMGARLRAIDEAHQDFHANFRQDLYTHIPWSINLSGSFESGDPFITQMMEICCPFAQRYHGDERQKYVDCTGIFYRFQEPRHIRSDGFKGAYSQVRFEQSILKRKHVRDNFLKMVCFYLDQQFRGNWIAEDRLLLYVGTVEMATWLVQKLSVRYPELPVVRYCRTEKDTLADAIAGSIIVSTTQSAGTNVDIPKLRTVFLLVAVDATAANIQGFGRLRNNVRDNLPPGFYWFTNTDNPKHMRYHRNKMDLLRDRAKLTSIMHYTQPL